MGVQGRVKRWVAGMICSVVLLIAGVCNKACAENSFILSMRNDGLHFCIKISDEVNQAAQEAEENFRLILFSDAQAGSERVWVDIQEQEYRLEDLQEDRTSVIDNVLPAKKACAAMFRYVNGAWEQLGSLSDEVSLSKTGLWEVRLPNTPSDVQTEYFSQEDADENRNITRIYQLRNLSVGSLSDEKKNYYIRLSDKIFPLETAEELYQITSDFFRDEEKQLYLEISFELGLFQKTPDILYKDIQDESGIELVFCDKILKEEKSDLSGQNTRWTEPSPEIETETETDTQSESDRDGLTEQATIGSNSMTEPRMESETISEGNSEAVTGSMSGNESEVVSVSMSETESESETRPELETESESETRPESETESEVVTESVLETKSELETENKAITETVSETESESGTESATEMGSTPETERGSETESMPGTGSQAETESGSELESEASTEAKSESAVETEIETEIAAGTAAETETETEAETEQGSGIISQTESEHENGGGEEKKKNPHLIPIFQSMGIGQLIATIMMLLSLFILITVAKRLMTKRNTGNKPPAVLENKPKDEETIIGDK